jgi:hypothetical protein
MLKVLQSKGFLLALCLVLLATFVLAFALRQDTSADEVMRDYDPMVASFIVFLGLNHVGTSFLSVVGIFGVALHVLSLLLFGKTQKTKTLFLGLALLILGACGILVSPLVYPKRPPPDTSSLLVMITEDRTPRTMTVEQDSVYEMSDGTRVILSALEKGPYGVGAKDGTPVVYLPSEDGDIKVSARRPPAWDASPIFPSVSLPFVAQILLALFSFVLLFIFLSRSKQLTRQGKSLYSLVVLLSLLFLFATQIELEMPLMSLGDLQPTRMALTVRSPSDVTLWHFLVPMTAKAPFIEYPWLFSFLLFCIGLFLILFSKNFENKFAPYIFTSSAVVAFVVATALVSISCARIPLESFAESLKTAFESTILPRIPSEVSVFDYKPTSNAPYGIDLPFAISKGFLILTFSLILFLVASTKKGRALSLKTISRAKSIAFFVAILCVIYSLLRCTQNPLGFVPMAMFQLFVLGLAFVVPSLHDDFEWGELGLVSLSLMTQVLVFLY